MTAHDRWLSSPYDDFRQNDIDAAKEAIRADDDRLHDAVYDDEGAAYKLAQLRIALDAAAWLLGKIAEGMTLEEIERMPGRPNTLNDFRALIRAADAAEKFVTERVEEAASEAVEVRA